MKILVCGGRDYGDEKRVFDELDALDKQWRIELVIHGDARGADSLAELWSRERLRASTGRKYRVTSEEWRQLGRKAGPLRNQRMLDEQQPDLVLAFPGDTGTADMVRRAKAGDYAVQEVPR